MPQISRRGQAMPESPIRKLAPFANAAQKNNVKVYHLNIGQPDIETPPSILAAVKDTDLKILAYSPSEGFESLRAGLEHYYRGKGIPVAKEDIMVTTGGSEAISFAFLACLNEGDEIIIPEPFYANYNGFSCISNVKIVPIRSGIEDNFALPGIEAFEKAITPDTKAIMICNPNNPTGYLYSREELELLRRICLKHDLFLFSDEAYREFCYDGATHISAMTLEGMERHVVLMDTFSKRYSACGARIGMLVTKNKDVYNTALKYAQARLSPPTLEQILGEAATKLPETYFDPILKEYEHRRNVLIGRLQKMEGVVVPNPGGAFYAMVKLPVADAEDFCTWMLSGFRHHNSTVMMAPAAGFYATPGLGKDEVRMAYVLKDTEIDAAMDCLEAGLKAYRQK